MSSLLIEKILREQGFYALTDTIDRLQARAHALRAAAKKEDGEHGFPLFPSYIPPRKPKGKVGAAFIIDIGGSSTKVAFRRASNEKETWEILFERANDSFLSQHSEKGNDSAFEVFASSVTAAIHSSAEHLALSAAEPLFLTVVWSNPMRNLPPDRCGISGVVSSRDNYRKGEWFTKSLQDGDDLGAPFRRGIEAQGYQLQKLLVGNDAPFTMTASAEADGGVVCSTGLNGTLVMAVTEDGEPVICNGELGGFFPMEKETLAQGDKLRQGQSVRCIEHLVSGKFLPQLFESYLSSLAAELRLEGEMLEGLSFKTADLTYIAAGEWRELAPEKRQLLEGGEQLQEKASFLAQELYKRSAKLAAIIAEVSIAHAKEASQPALLALDSRLAREMPLWWEQFQVMFAHLTQHYAEPPQLKLLEPEQGENGIVSVPMLGGARALDRLFGSESLLLSNDNHG